MSRRCHCHLTLDSQSRPVKGVYEVIQPVVVDEERLCSASLNDVGVGRGSQRASHRFGEV